MLAVTRARTTRAARGNPGGFFGTQIGTGPLRTHGYSLGRCPSLRSPKQPRSLTKLDGASRQGTPI
jgi:hypothetical protein